MLKNAASLRTYALLCASLGLISCGGIKGTGSSNNGGNNVARVSESGNGGDQSTSMAPKSLPGIPTETEVPEEGIENATSSSSSVGAFVDIRDEIKYKSNPIARGLLNAIKEHTTDFFPSGVRFDPKGVGFDDNSRVNAVFGVEILGDPVPQANGRFVILAGALLHDGRNFLFRKWRLLFDSNAQVIGLNLISDILASDLQLRIRTSIIQRKAILESPNGLFKIIYPIGVGGVDERDADGELLPHGQLALLSTYVQHGGIPHSYIIDKRNNPPIYRSRPFLRIRGPQSDQGFHIYQPRAGLQRAFLSHGCFHMQEKDLYELHAFLKESRMPETPVSVDFDLPDEEDSPLPLRNDGYYKTYYKFDDGKWIKELGKYDLFKMIWVRGRLPLERLVRPSWKYPSDGISTSTDF